MPDDLRITVDEVRRRQNGGEEFGFLDSRNPQAWAESDAKIPGAIRVPLEQLQQHLSEIPKNKPIVAYCT